MPTKPKFQPVGQNRSPVGEPVPFTPLIFLSGTQAHRLALHLDTGSTAFPKAHREWVVSHPEIGAIICRVRGLHKGVPVSSRGFTVTQARAAAMACLDDLCERIGSDAFNDKIAAETAKEAK
jgi:hypothetical protein